MKSVLLAAALFWAPPDDPTASKKLMERICGHCHKVEIVTSRRLTRERWQETIQAMVDKGAEGTEDEFNTILDYLAKYYGPESGKEKPKSSK